MKRVADAGGAKYSVHGETARRHEPIAPVGTSYTPVGRPDIAAMRSGVQKDVIAPVVSRSHDASGE